jgi:hypothetical protein
LAREIMGRASSNKELLSRQIEWARAKFDGKTSGLFYISQSFESVNSGPRQNTNNLQDCIWINSFADIHKPGAFYNSKQAYLSPTDMFVAIHWTYKAWHEVFPSPRERLTKKVPKQFSELVFIILLAHIARIMCKLRGRKKNVCALNF